MTSLKFLISFLFLFSLYGREFEGLPYVLEVTDESVKCFDPKDPEFGAEGVPFLIMDAKGEEIVELGKTNHFSGSKIVALAKSLQKELGSPVLHLTDTALSLPCERNGKWCCDEALMDMRMVSVFIKGKSYYEMLGAEAEDGDFREAARFIHEMPVADLMQELSSELLGEIITALELPRVNLTMGQLSLALYRAGKENEYAHGLWHKFHDRFIAGSGFMTQLIRTGDPDLQAILKREVDQCIARGYTFDEDFTAFQRRQFFDRLSNFSRSPALFLPARASDQCLSRTADAQGFVKNHPKLYDLYSMKTEPKPQSLLTRWFLAKEVIRQSKRFTFRE